MSLPVAITEEYLYACAPNARAAQAGQELAHRSAFADPHWTADGLWLSASCAGSAGRYQVTVDLSETHSPEQVSNSDGERPGLHRQGCV